MGVEESVAVLAALTSSHERQPLSVDLPSEAPRCSIEACGTGAQKSVSTMASAHISANVVGDSAAAATCRCHVENRASHDADTRHEASTDR